MPLVLLLNWLVLLKRLLLQRLIQIIPLTDDANRMELILGRMLFQLLMGMPLVKLLLGAPSTNYVNVGSTVDAGNKTGSNGDPGTEAGNNHTNIGSTADDGSNDPANDGNSIGSTNSNNLFAGRSAARNEASSIDVDGDAGSTDTYWE